MKSSEDPGMRMRTHPNYPIIRCGMPCSAPGNLQSLASCWASWAVLGGAASPSVPQHYYVSAPGQDYGHLHPQGAQKEDGEGTEERKKITKLLVLLPCAPGCQPGIVVPPKPLARGRNPKSSSASLARLPW